MIFGCICIILLISFFLWAMVATGKERREMEWREELKSIFQQNDD